MIALVPARGGSKGLPGKNTKLLCGKPLIVWTIETALKSSHIEEVIVSTEDAEISNVAKKHGGKIPFMRPAELATDAAIATDSYLYTIKRLNTEFGYKIENFIVLLPTSPLRLTEDIDNAIQIFHDKQASSVMSFSKFNHPPEWAVRIFNNGSVKQYFAQISEGKNRQEFETPYVCNGSIYILKNSLLKKTKKYYYPDTYAYIMPQERSVDIDTEIDFKFAEFMMSENEKS